jgi:hypothetical protein
VEVQLSREDLELLIRPVAGQGGWQSLLRKLQRQIDGNTLTLSEDDSRRILRYILSYGSGGWQDRLAAIAGGPAQPAKARRAVANKTRKVAARKK